MKSSHLRSVLLTLSAAQFAGLLEVAGEDAVEEWIVLALYWRIRAEEGCVVNSCFEGSAGMGHRRLAQPDVRGVAIVLELWGAEGTSRSCSEEGSKIPRCCEAPRRRRSL